MPDSVVDASVVGAIVFAEPAADEAAALVGGSKLFAPRLLAYELASIARTKAVRFPELTEKLLDALERGLRMEVNWQEVDHTATVRLAVANGISTYDASYLYVARALGLPLVTFDRRLAMVAAAS